MTLPDRYQTLPPPVGRDHVVTAARPPLYAPAPPPQDFLETVRKLWRNRRLILGCTVIIGAVATAVAVRMPSHYVAEARVLVGVPGPRVLNAETIIADLNPDAERVQNEGFVIQSRELAAQVVERLGLSDNPEFNPALRSPGSRWRRIDPGAVIAAIWRALFSDRGQETAVAVSQADTAATATRRQDRIIDVLLSKVDVSTLGRSHVLSIQAESQNADVASAVSNAFAELYLDHQRQEKIQTTGRVEKFLEDRIAELRQQVQKSEQAVEDYRRQYGLYRGASSGVTSQQLTESNTQLILAQTAKAEADARVREAEALRQQGVAGESVPDVLRSPLIQALKQQQAEAERRLAEMSASYGDRHPKVINARAEISDIRRKVQTEIGHTIDGLRREGRTANARYEAQRQNFERAKSQMGGVNERAIHLESLERDATVNRNLLEAMLSRAKQTVGQEEMQQANAKLISRAAPPGSPSYPPKALLVFLGTLGGLLAGAVTALLRESVDRTFRRSDQIESATGLPVIAMVPNVKGRTPPNIHVLRKPVSPYSEALRKLHVGLELSEAAQSPKVVMFCSATPAEGKSVLVSSLGRLLASNGKRIMLIDCDWRCPNLHRIFHCSNRGGLAALLTDEGAGLGDIVHNDALSGLDLIPAGNWSPQHIHTLTSDRMRLILQTFAKNYDLVILDTPPVLVGAEVLTLSRIVEKVVFAVRWGHTRREVALEAIKQIIEAQGDVAGVVMSRVDSKRYRQYAYGHLNYEYTRPALTRLG